MADAHLRINRMVLRWPNRDRAEADRLVQAVRKRMEDSMSQRPVHRSAGLGTLRVRIQSEPGDTTDGLARRVADTILDIARS